MGVKQRLAAAWRGSAGPVSPDNTAARLDELEQQWATLNHQLNVVVGDRIDGLATRVGDQLLQHSMAQRRLIDERLADLAVLEAQVLALQLEVARLRGVDHFSPDHG
ncbi:MAG: hypothetical protein JWL70_990 [Acidimicrobiia bacterium]|nr:hypothetical protein [Acidimicrobiia bacterium]